MCLRCYEKIFTRLQGFSLELISDMFFRGFKVKILTVLGARPQFIKAAAISREILSNYTRGNGKSICEVIVHTGQHFDANMSNVFFEQMDIPTPDYNLKISGFSHGKMTGRMIEEIEELLKKERPDCVLLYGDTNSTLAGAIATSKMGIPVVHVEAGLRSHNMSMPEEINRILTDRVSDYLFCPTESAVKNLKLEGFPFETPRIKNQLINNVGDVMLDAMLFYKDKASKEVGLEGWGIKEKEYALCTLHRQENTDDPSRLLNILSALQEVSISFCPVLLPLHPRTKKKIVELNSKDVLDGIKVVEPLSYLEIQRLQMGAKMIFTDSGGMQKEAYFHKVPCITLRDETEWVETVDSGWNKLAGASKVRILQYAHDATLSEREHCNHYGDGEAAKKIVKCLSENI